MPVAKIDISKHLGKESINIDKLCEAIHRDVTPKKIRQILRYYRNISKKRQSNEFFLNLL